MSVEGVRAGQRQNIDESVTVLPNRRKNDTYLPHWGPLRRLIHEACYRSRYFNSVVSAVEMRLGAEESLCLPQYISLCLTGRCNAQCGFCSVTINRTGVIKKDMSFDRLHDFLGPTLNVARMYGLEGNGEPTIYGRFDDAVDMLTSGGADAYLITNGVRIKREQIPKLLKLETINFSLNAATAETHRAVMKLEEFDYVVELIKELIRVRATNYFPRVTVSLVVEDGNVHEVQKFLRFAEYDLGVDRVYLRPLSELGSDISVVEDLRGLVPCESDITDMFGAVRDYLNDVPRRAEIIFEPDSFKADRPDPIDRTLMPRGYEGRLLAPRRDDWQAGDACISLAWNLNRLRVHAPAVNGPATLCSSAPIPVDPHRALVFEAVVTVEAGAVEVIVTDAEGIPVAGETLTALPGECQRISLTIETAEHEHLRLIFRDGGDGCVAEIDFGCLRTPAPSRRKSFKLPHRRRWEVDCEDATVDWPSDDVVTVSYSGQRWKYLLKSFFVSCAPNETIALDARIIVQGGELAMGLLDEDAREWVKQWTFGQGPHDARLTTDAGGNERLKLVLYAETDHPLDARVEWGNSIEIPPPKFLTEERDNGHEPAGETGGAPGSTADRGIPDRMGWNRLRRLILRGIYGDVRYACQKPWTDLANFSVGGRMDVCCVATGESQKRYALGNALSQSLQEVWNGERMREFRRTVNGRTPLPPCQRCPMLYAYQGPLFAPNDIKGALRSRLFRGATTPFMKGLREVLLFPVALILDTVVFRGFKR